MHAFFSKNVTLPSSGLATERNQQRSFCGVSLAWTGLHSPARSKHRLKLAGIFALLGLFMLAMGCIVHIEKSAIEVEYQNTSYMYIAANALLALGVIFVLLSLLRICSSCTGGQDGEPRGEVSEQISPRGSSCYVIPVDPPKYSDVVKQEDICPPSYSEVVTTTKVGDDSHFAETSCGAEVV